MRHVRRGSVKSVFAVAGKLLGILFWAQGAGAQSPSAGEEIQLKLDGDLGMAAYYARSIVREKTDSVTVLPYANFDYGRVFARIDTFGIKTAKMAHGYLEFAGRVELDGFKADNSRLHGLNGRANSIPLGFGTLQETPVGAWYVNAFHDFGKSDGNLVDITYAVSVATGKITIFPQAGVEFFSKQYVRYYYGVTSQEAVASRYGYYRPGAAIEPYAGALVETRISGHWHFIFLIRHNWLANSIADSPLVAHKGANNAFVSFAYRFM